MKGYCDKKDENANQIAQRQSLTFLVPIGSIFLAFLTNYGLMEFVGVFVRPLMRRIWKTPGRSAIDAVASFVGSYSVALSRCFPAGCRSVPQRQEPYPTPYVFGVP